MMYLILCKERTQGIAMWWRPESRRYTTDTTAAGRYSKEEADLIAGIRGEDYPVPEDALGSKLQLRTIVDVADVGNFEALHEFAPSQANPCEKP